MPRAGWVKPQSDQRLTDHVALGVLTRTFPPSLVDRVLEQASRLEQRHRLLPARLVVYYVLGLALFADASYEEVMRNLVEGLAWESGWRQEWSVPTKGAISQARDRLGAGPMQALFAAGCVPLASADVPGGFYRSWRLMAIDGTTLDVADTAANDGEFGRPGTSSGNPAAFPQLRLVGLAECGTHALVEVALGKYREAERSLAGPVLETLRSGMLLLADRGFYSFDLWTKAQAHGADLLWRMPATQVLPAIETLPDGSYLSTVHEIKNYKRVRGEGLPVRVVEYTIDDSGRPQVKGSYRLLTTIMDPAAAPAEELAALYSQRWEFETLLDELKTHQRGPRIVLRSKSPEGVRQETYGLLCTHYAIRALMAAAAADHDDLDPDRISFTRSIRAARRSVRAGIGTTTAAINTALREALTEIGDELLPRRRLRAAARVIKRKMSNWNLKRPEHRNWPRPTRPIGAGVLITRPP